MSRSLTRWVVPVGVALAVGGVAAATTALRASAQPELPGRSAAQLLVDLQTARLEGLSGTVVLRSDLGLPALPALGGSGQLGALLNGSNTLRVWYSGPDKTRLALLGTLGESDIIRNGRDVWIWSSKDQSATHHRLPEGALSTPNGQLLDPKLLPATPQEVADRVLAAIEPSTAVSTAANTTIAGRSAYELVLAPRDEASLVRQVRVAVDGERHLPLRVQVFAKGHPTPAFEIGFRQVSFARPGEEHFRFTPPPGTRVEEGGAPNKLGLPGGQGWSDRRGDKPAHPAEPGKPAEPGNPAKPTEPANPAKPDGDRADQRPTVVGEAWTAVLVAKVPAAGPNGSLDVPFGVLLNSLPAVKGEWGSGRLLRSRLLTALLTDDGRLLVGAVTPERLYAVAAAGG